MSVPENQSARLFCVCMALAISLSLTTLADVTTLTSEKNLGRLYNHFAFFSARALQRVQLAVLNLLISWR